jgi:hypothetical protein
MEAEAGNHKKDLPPSHKDTNASDQLSVISNQFPFTDHFSLITVHRCRPWCLGGRKKVFHKKHKINNGKIIKRQTINPKNCLGGIKWQSKVQILSKRQLT